MVFALYVLCVTALWLGAAHRAEITRVYMFYMFCVLQPYDLALLTDLRLPEFICFICPVCYSPMTWRCSQSWDYQSLYVLYVLCVTALWLGAAHRPEITRVYMFYMSCVLQPYDLTLLTELRLPEFIGFICSMCYSLMTWRCSQSWDYQSFTSKWPKGASRYERRRWRRSVKSRSSRIIRGTWSGCRTVKHALSTGTNGT